MPSILSRPQWVCPDCPRLSCEVTQNRGQIASGGRKHPESLKLATNGMCQWMGSHWFSQWLGMNYLTCHYLTGDPLHSRALAHSRAPLLTQSCPHCSHSRAPGEKWAQLCVFYIVGLCASCPAVLRVTGVSELELAVYQLDTQEQR